MLHILVRLAFPNWWKSQWAINLPPRASTSTTSAPVNRHRKSLKASAKVSKSKKSSKPASRYEKQKEKALARIYKKAASKRASSSHSAGSPQLSQLQLALQLSPGSRQGRDASINPPFPIDVSGIWGPQQEVLPAVPPPINTTPPTLQRMDTIPPTSSAVNQPNSLCMVNFQDIIATAISQGIAAGLQQRDEQSVPAQPSDRPALPPAPLVTAEPSAPDGESSEHSSDSEEGEIKEAEMSEDEGRDTDQKTFSGLFPPTLFPSFLYKAKMAADFGTQPSSATPRPATVSAETLFSEQAPPSETIPTPKIFVDLVQRQWEVPTSGPTQSASDKKFFNVANDLVQFLSISSIDAPVTALYTSANMPGPPEDVLKPEDRKSDLTLQRSRQATAWAVRASTTASFFTRSCLL